MDGAGFVSRDELAQYKEFKECEVVQVSKKLLVRYGV